MLLKAFQVALHFSSLVLLSSTQTFLLARVQHFQPLSQSKFIPSEYWEVDHVKDEERPNLNQFGKNSRTIGFITPSLAAKVYAGAFSEECKFEIIGHFQRMIHDT